MSGWGAGYPGVPADVAKARQQAEAAQAPAEEPAADDAETDEPVQG